MDAATDSYSILICVPLRAVCSVNDVLKERSTDATQKEIKQLKHQKTDFSVTACLHSELKMQTDEEKDFSPF